MQYLIFDTETTGLPRSWKAPLTQLANWPRMVQLAWLLYDDEGTELQRYAAIIKPEGFVIPEQAARIHGITTEKALSEGIGLVEALQKFAVVLERERPTLVAHNMAFDEKIVGAELLRTKLETVFFDLPKQCTMQSSIQFCNLPGLKYPRLEELYLKFFGAKLTQAHQADADAIACARCFFELKKLKVM